jgi:hypothetical protein
MRSLLLLAAVAAALLASTPASAVPPGWAPTGSMQTGRSAHVAALLRDGRVLVAGGSTTGLPIRSAELYDPATGTWTATGSLNVGRLGAVVSVLPDGRVLVAGGITEDGRTASAERYDPASGIWSVVSAMTTPRDGAVAVALDSGRVLVAGGNSGAGTLSSAEVYDPATGTWTPTAAMSATREEFGAVKLANGKVLVAGGYVSGGGFTVRNAAELYDPATGTWAPTGPLATGRTQFSLLGLRDGTVLAPGGLILPAPLASTERYDPAMGTWAPTGAMSRGRDVYAATVLSDGRALVLGTLNGNGVDNRSEVYDPLTGTWSDGGTLSAPRGRNSATLLPDGRVLTAGGPGAPRTAAAELWTPETTRAADAATFGALEVGAAAERDVTVRVTGANRLWASGATVTGADASDFGVVSDGCAGASVPAGGSCVVRVRFTPGTEGDRAAVLRLADNVVAGADIPLTGSGVRTPPPPVRTEPTPQPVAPVATPPAGTAKPRLPCVSRRLFYTALKSRMRSGTATLAGKRVARITSKTRRVRVDLRGRKAGVYTLRIKGVTRSGRKVTDVRQYRTCAPKR